MNPPTRPFQVFCVQRSGSRFTSYFLTKLGILTTHELVSPIRSTVVERFDHEHPGDVGWNAVHLLDELTYAHRYHLLRNPLKSIPSIARHISHSVIVYMTKYFGECPFPIRFSRNDKNARRIAAWIWCEITERIQPHDLPILRLESIEDDIPIILKDIGEDRSDEEIGLAYGKAWKEKNATPGGSPPELKISELPLQFRVRLEALMHYYGYKEGIDE